MKSYARILFFFFILVFLAGCGEKEIEQEAELTTSTAEISAEIVTEEQVTVDDVTDVETVEEDLSLNDEGDDYGDII